MFPRGDNGPSGESLGDMRPTYMFRGILAALLGICALFWPSATHRLRADRHLKESARSPN